jgi:hypothetical protein
MAVLGQFFEDPDQRQLLEQPWPHSLPTIRRVLLPIVPASAVAGRHARTRMGLSRPQRLPDRVPRYLQVTGDLLDRLALDEVLTP